MSDKSNPIEEMGDTLSDKELADTINQMSDLELGHLAGFAEVAKGFKCSDAQVASGETDGTCRVYNAAIEAYQERAGGKPHSR